MITGGSRILPCLIVSLVLLGQAHGDVPALLPIPPNVSKEAQAALEARATDLRQQLSDLKKRNDAFLRKYGGGVPEGTPEARQAEKEQADLEKAQGEYVAAVERFNKDVAAAPKPAPTVTGKALAWEDKEHPERKAWSDELRRTIEPNIPVLETAADLSNYAPNYASLSKSQRLDVWASLLVAIANFESPDFKTNARFVEKNIRDKQGNLVAPFPSVGLLMLSYKEGEQRAYGYEPLDEKKKSLEDPLVNLRCGVKVLTYWVKHDGVIAGGSEQAPRGGARYWSVLRAGKGHHLQAIQEMVKKQAQVE